VDFEVYRSTTASYRGQANWSAFYYAFGDDDVYVIADLPDHASMAAVSLTVSVSRAVATSARPC